MTFEDIRSIPGNGPVIEELKKFLTKKKAIAFVGAGASVGMYPLWGELIEKLAEYTVDRGKATPSDSVRWKADRSSTPQQRVNTIIRKLGDDCYRQFLRETFAPRYSPDGNRYTPTHAALMRLPFRGYVTTNYDPALEFARMDIRPSCLTTGTPTWQDEDEIHRWLTGDIFDPPSACPILWLHGHWQRPFGIVLNAGEYAIAYKPGLYRKTFHRLWEQDHLVFAGFGFNDPQFTFMIGEILRDLTGAHAEPRHIAILGLQSETPGNELNQDVITEARANMEADYHVKPLFYRINLLPSGEQDHADLRILLENVAASSASPAMGTSLPFSPPLSPKSLPQRWVHETTNDRKFIGREEECARLDRWVSDSAVRAIGITAIGGTGKTALIGHWLKNTQGWLCRPFIGLFAWSFYQERNSGVFLRALLAWSSEIIGTTPPDDQIELVPAALKLLRQSPIVVVLDGLEVLQEGPEETRHGAFLDGTLREFLGVLCIGSHESLAVLTSRFAFADLERYLGVAFHQLELLGLPQEQGASLLSDLEVRGLDADRAQVSRRLEGHPLGLRVFAEAISEDQKDQPSKFLDDAFRTGRLSQDSPLSGKIRRLLLFYQEKLPVTLTRLLSVVALFRAPVPEDTTLSLTRDLFGRKRKSPLPDNSTLSLGLQKLYARGILTREAIDQGYGYACHPILRDHFRATLIKSSATTAKRAANSLGGTPSRSISDAKELEPILLAIELLLDSGDFRAADALFDSHIKDRDLFTSIPAISEGFRCVFGFVQDEYRRKQCERQLSKRHLSFYLNEAGLLSTLRGDYGLGFRLCQEAQSMARELNRIDDICTSLGNEACLLIFSGRLPEAAIRAAEVLMLTQNLKDKLHFWAESKIYSAWVHGLSGRVQLAVEDFAIAKLIEEEFFSDSNKSVISRDMRWADILFRLGYRKLVAGRMQQNIRSYDRQGLNHEVARCHWILGCCALAEAQLEEAESELRMAESFFESSQMLFELARLHVTAGFLALARRDTSKALDRAAEALVLSQSRGMRLVHSNALILRGRSRLLDATSLNSQTKSSASNLHRSLDDSLEALVLARDCGYAWAERDALSLQADAFQFLAKTTEAPQGYYQDGRYRDAADKARGEANTLSAKLSLTEDDFQAAEEKASSWLRKRLAAKPMAEEK